LWPDHPTARNGSGWASLQMRRKDKKTYDAGKISAFRVYQEQRRPRWP